MKTIIAEKPSVAREIAAVVGAKTRKDGYLEGSGYYVTWAFGHLVTLAMPGAYAHTESISSTRYSFRVPVGTLPILPKDFKLKPRQVKGDRGYKNDPGALKQLGIIKELFEKSDRIIVATDAGREGELIFRWIHYYLKSQTPFDRLWISSLTDKAIREGLANLKDRHRFDDLYRSARARAHADWLIGINASQALSIAAGHGVWSLGRVQTPTLALICRRYLENKDFTPQTYYQLKLHTAKDATVFSAISLDRYDESATSTEALKKVRGAKIVKVVDVETKIVEQQAPLLYDLTTLQKEANTKHGFSAERTLKVAQTLYERGVITYPRTGCRYIPTDVMAEVPTLIDGLKQHQRFSGYATALSAASLNSHSIDNRKITDHHALIITENIPHALADDQRTIYEMVAGRFLESFSEKCKKENTLVTLECEEMIFTSRGSVTLVPGWRSIFNTIEEPTDDATMLPEMVKSDQLPVMSCELLEKQTKPRSIHTEASLLGAMESAGKTLDDDRQREAISECGLGTPATRASIIETLFARNYVRREKRSLIPTDKGLAVYNVVKDKRIADVAMTGEWEAALTKIESGEMNDATFHRGIEVYAAQITSELLEVKFDTIATGGASAECECPKCKTGKVRLYPKVAKCHNEECDFILFRQIAGKELTDSQIYKLLTSGSTETIRGFKGKSAFNAAVKLDDNFKTAFDFEQKQTTAKRETTRK